MRRTPFSRRRNESEYLTQKSLKPFYETYFRSVQLLLKIIPLLEKERNILKIDVEYNRAASTLINKSLQHFESVIVLTEQGLYGDATALMRNVTSDLLMLDYLNLHPELVSKFLEETKTTYQDDSSFKKIFNEVTMIRELQSHGSVLSMETFSIMSKASHSSHWGSQMYAYDLPNGDIAYKNGPRYEFKKSVAHWAMIVAAPFDFARSVMRHRVHTKLDMISKEWRLVHKEIVAIEPTLDALQASAREVVFKR